VERFTRIALSVGNIGGFAMAHATVRPSRVIWITTDHQRFDCVAANGNPAIHTPNLDRLVKGGVSFDNVFIQHPACMPSRASFMTGLYPTQTGVTCNGMELPFTGVQTCADIFAQNGFETAQIGKLHFQCHWSHDLRLSPRHPYGFHYFMLAEEPGRYDDAYGMWLRTEHPEHAREMTMPRVFFAGPKKHEKHLVTVEAPAEFSHPGFCATQTIKYLTHCQGQPRCFLHMGMYAPHPPFNPPKDIFARYANAALPQPEWREDETADKPDPLRRSILEYRKLGYDATTQRRYFYAMCTLLDSQVGRLLDFLEKRGELDDTLILFMSDHGDMLGDHSLYNKSQYYHQVLRVPAIMHWPRGLSGGRRVAGLVEAVDLLPTLCDLAGVNPAVPMSGISIADALRSGKTESLRPDVLTMHGAPQQPLEGALRTAEFNYIRFGQGREVLFDLKRDPNEFVNCAQKDEYRPRLVEMRERLLDRILAAGRSTLPAHFPY
jgi:arylsulfatase A-like enzyme